MDYSRLAEASLDEIMKKIRRDLAGGAQFQASGAVGSEGHFPPSTSGSIPGLYLNISLDGQGKHLTEMQKGEKLAKKAADVGLNRAPMLKKRGLTRALSRVLETLYLRVAEWSNRDIRAFHHATVSFMENCGAETLVHRKSIQKLARHMNALHAGIEKACAQAQDLSEQVSALNAVVQWANSHEFDRAADRSDRYTDEVDDLFRHSFEERFLGTRSQTKERLSVYLPRLWAQFGTFSDKRCIDLRCGRGDWLELLRENGADESEGIDTSVLHVKICLEHGLNASRSECLEYLKSQPAKSAYLITGFQLLERYPFAAQLAVLRESYRVLKQGGMVLFEMLDPSDSNAGSSRVCFDPTVVSLLHPELAVFLAERSGFSLVETLRGEDNSWKGKKAAEGSPAGIPVYALSGVKG